MNKLREKKFQIEIKGTLTLDQIAFELVDQLPMDCLPLVVALIDNLAEDWDVTEGIFNHMEAIRPAYEEAVHPSVRFLKSFNQL